MKKVDEFYDCKLLDRLIEIMNCSVYLDTFAGTHVYETDTVSVSCLFDKHEGTITILSIVSRKKGSGRRAIEAIHTFADEVRCDVYADSVAETAKGFWQKMGYEETSEKDLWVRMV